MAVEIRSRRMVAYQVRVCAVQVSISLEEAEQGTTVLRLHHTSIPHEDKYGNSDVEGTTRHGWQNLILHRIKAVFGYGL